MADLFFYIQIGVAALFFIWLVFLTFLFLKQKSHYQKLTNKTQKMNLQQALEKILKSQQVQSKNIDLIKGELENLEKDGKYHLQKIGFVRFNPFADTGGDQSFALSFLDNNNTGVVFSFLHSRDTTRVYAKQIKNGKSEKFPLSKEEEKVITNARFLKS